MGNQNRQSGHRTAFTLIELLVVITVIFLLLSILLPSLKEAKEQGRRVHCQTNLHQMMLAWTSYGGEYGERMCSASIELNCPKPWLTEEPPSSSFPLNSWVSVGEGLAYNPILGTEESLQLGVLWDYLQVPDVYKCLSHKNDYLVSYSISQMMGAHVIAPYKTIYNNVTNIVTPGQRMVFCDGRGIRLREPTESNYPDIYDVETHGFNPINAQSCSWWSCSCGTLSTLVTRHSKGMNVTFADGRAAYYRWKDRRTIQNDDGMTAIPEPGSETDNEDFDFLVRACYGKCAAAANSDSGQQGKFNER